MTDKKSVLLRVLFAAAITAFMAFATVNLAQSYVKYKSLLFIFLTVISAVMCVLAFSALVAEIVLYTVWKKSMRRLRDLAGENAENQLKAGMQNTGKQNIFKTKKNFALDTAVIVVFFCLFAAMFIFINQGNGGAAFGCLCACAGIFIALEVITVISFAIVLRKLNALIKNSLQSCGG